MPRGMGAKQKFISGAAHGSYEERVAAIVEGSRQLLAKKKVAKNFAQDSGSKAHEIAKALESYLSDKDKHVKDDDLQKACIFLYSFCKLYKDELYEVTSKYFVLLGETFYKRWETSAKDTHIKMAEECLNTALKHFSISDSFKAATKAEQKLAYTKLAEVYLHAKEYDSWLKCATAILAFNPKDTKAQLFVAQHYLHFDKSQEAHKLLLKVHKAEPGNKILKQVVNLHKAKFESCDLVIEDMLQTPQNPESKLQAELQKVKADLEAMQKARAEAEATAAQAKASLEVEQREKEAAQARASEKAAEAEREIVAAQEKVGRLENYNDKLEKDVARAQKCAVDLAMKIPALRNEHAQTLHKTTIIATQTYLQGVQLGASLAEQQEARAWNEGVAIGFQQGVAATMPHIDVPHAGGHPAARSDFGYHADGLLCADIMCTIGHSPYSPE